MAREETICKIEVTDSNELLAVLDAPGDPDFQFVYREAAGVYWDPQRNGFRSTPIQEWSCSDWFFHITDIVRSGLHVSLKLAPEVEWVDVPLEDRQKILSKSEFL